MLTNIIVFLLTTAVLLVICKMAFSYWQRSENRLTAEELDNLTFWEKVAYAFDFFCKRVNESADFPEIEIKKEFGGFKND